MAQGIGLHAGADTAVRVSDGRQMLDGGISDSIPLEYFQLRGFERNVVVLTQPRDYRKQPAKKWLFKLLMPYAPAIAEAMGRRHEMYNSQLDYIARQEAAGNTLIIAPEHPLPIGRIETDHAKMRHVYGLGREAALAALPSVKSFLGA